MNEYTRKKVKIAVGLVALVLCLVLVVSDIILALLALCLPESLVWELNWSVWLAYWCFWESITKATNKQTRALCLLAEGAPHFLRLC